MPTVDANVWVAAFDTKDRFHADGLARVSKVRHALGGMPGLGVPRVRMFKALGLPESE